MSIPNLQNSALLTDYYQLTMLQSYFNEAMNQEAVFEFFIRRLPDCRNFFVVAGIEQALEYIEQIHFTDQEIAWLRKTGDFSDPFIDYLNDFKFSGDVYGVSEGTIVFQNEPILQVIAPLPEAQLIESRLINLLQYQIMIASKAVRSVLTVPDKVLVDFGMRRAHGAEAALYASRANYIAGFNGTATVLAGIEFGIPLFGTMAHSYIQAHPNELESFYDFAKTHPDNVVLLIDTYDIEAGANKVVQLSEGLKNEGITIKAVRIDSGDPVEEAKKVRAILDAGNCREIQIFCSGDLDEYQLKRLTNADAPIDGFGIGTRLDTSNDAPSLDCVFKLQAYAGKPNRKKSEGKATWPGRKQIYRYYEGNCMSHDVLTLFDDNSEQGTPLLEPLMQKGKIIADLPKLPKIRDLMVDNLRQLPENLRMLEKADSAYEVIISPALQELTRELD